MHTTSMRTIRGVLVAACSAGLLSACLSGSGGTSAPAKPTVSVTGSVIDGYVQGANITAYSDQAMTQAIGSTITGTKGSFTIHLQNVSTPPSKIYLKSSGGINADTGTLAPTLLFAGSGVGGIYVSPITNLIAQMAQTRTLMQAENELAANSGLTPSDLFKNPLTDTNLINAKLLTRVLASGKHESALAPAKYNFYEVGVSTSQIGQTIEAVLFSSVIHSPGAYDFSLPPGTLTVNSGSGSDVSGTGDPAVITGEAYGNAILLNAVSPKKWFGRISGVVGLFGSATMNSDMLGGALSSNTPGSRVAPGLQIWGLTPSSKTINFAKLESKIKQFYLTKTYHMLFHQGYGNVDILGWGNVKFSNFSPSGIVTGNVTVGQVAGNGSAQSTVTLRYNSAHSQMYHIDKTNNPVDIAAIHYDEMKSGVKVGEVYVIFAPGNPKGIYVVANTSHAIQGFGSVYLLRKDDVVPTLQLGKTYDMEIAAVDPSEIFQQRLSVIKKVMYSLKSKNSLLDTSKLTNGFETYSPPNGMGTFVVNGRAMGWLSDNSNDGMSRLADFAVIGLVSPSGAISGEIQHGGCMTFDSVNRAYNVADCGTAASQLNPAKQNVIRMKNRPSPFVAFPFVSGSPQPTGIGGKFDFLARSIFTNDYANFQQKFFGGHLTITGAPNPSATITFSTWSAPPAHLAVTLIDGMYHMKGTIQLARQSGATSTNDMGYLDLYWPVGGDRAIYLLSTKAHGSVHSIGEMYINR